MSPSPSQRYLSTRGGSYNLSFEEVVLKGLAHDGGLFIPEDIPSLPSDWSTAWQNLSFNELAFEIFSLYIASTEIPSADLREIIQRSYSSFRSTEVTPIVTLDKEKQLHLLELFHGPTFAFKDVALQLLGNLFEYFLIRKNRGRPDDGRYRLTVIGATSGDTGSAAIYGLRGKKDIDVFILHPKGKISPVQEAQMTTVLDPNVHNIAAEGTFDDCQAMVKALFADPVINKTQNLGAVNSINWARILAQITYYFQAYFTLLRSGTISDASKLRFVVPTGNFGDVLAGYYAKRMGLPAEKLVIATNENDILYRFWTSGHYEKHAVHGQEAQGGIAEDGAKAHPSGVKETLSPAMDILVSSNFERLLWYLAFEAYGSDDVPSSRETAGKTVKGWLEDLKTRDGFGVEKAVLELASRDFESERVSDAETVEVIKRIFITTKPTISGPETNGAGPATSLPAKDGYVLGPHSAVGVAAALRSISHHPPPETHHISLATAHPAKFAHAVDLALTHEEGFSFDKILPEAFVGLEKKERRIHVLESGKGWEGIRSMVDELRVHR